MEPPNKKSKVINPVMESVSMRITQSVQGVPTKSDAGKNKDVIESEFMGNQSDSNSTTSTGLLEKPAISESAAEPSSRRSPVVACDGAQNDDSEVTPRVTR
ncbi:hypothetical protein COOONC_04733 [Cooperia oncophora]